MECFDSQRSSTQHAHLSLRVNSVKNLFSLLSAIYNGKKDCYTTISANSKGIRASVDNAAKSLFAISLLKHELFQEYDLPLVRGEGTEVRFKINLAALLECLAIYGPASMAVTSLHLAYAEEDGKLNLLLEEGGITTECTLCTVSDSQEGDDGADFESAFQRHPIVGKCVITADTLHDVIKEMVDQPSAKSVQFTMSPSDPFFRMHTTSSYGAATMDVHSNSDSFISFACAAPVTFIYYTPLLQCTLRALAASEQTFVRINEAGILHLANKVQADASSTMFVNFVIMPEEADTEPDADAAAASETTDSAEQAYATLVTGVNLNADAEGREEDD